MSTSLLYHGFGVRDYRYVRTRYVPGGVIFTIERKMETCRCTVCGSENIWRQGVVVRRFRTVPIGSKGIELEARIPRLACQDCGAVRQADIGFAEPRRSCTKAFHRDALAVAEAIRESRSFAQGARAAGKGPSAERAASDRLSPQRRTQRDFGNRTTRKRPNRS